MSDFIQNGPSDQAPDDKAEDMFGQEMDAASVEKSGEYAAKQMSKEEKERYFAEIDDENMGALANAAYAGGKPDGFEWVEKPTTFEPQMDRIAREWAMNFGRKKRHDGAGDH